MTRSVRGFKQPWPIESNQTGLRWEFAHPLWNLACTTFCMECNVGLQMAFVNLVHVLMTEKQCLGIASIDLDTTVYPCPCPCLGGI